VTAESVTVPPGLTPAATSQPGPRAAQPAARRSSGAPGEPRLVPYLYIAPAFLLFLAFVLAPLLHTVWLSFFSWDGISLGEWVGLGNYSTELADPALRTALTHSLVFVITFCVLPVAVGLIVATILSRQQLRGLAAFRTILFLPQVMAMVVVGVAWRWMYADTGTVNQLLQLVGLPAGEAWLGSFTWALPFIGLVGTWVMTGLCMVLFLAGVGNIDVELYDAARVDGAGAVREFFAVTLPGLRQELSVALTITVIAALRSFDLVYVTTGGGPGTATIVPGTEIYRLAFRDGQVGAACAVAVLLTVVIFAVVAVITRIVGEES